MSILNALGGNLLDGASKIIGKFVQDPSEKAAMELETKKLIHAKISEQENTIRTTMKARERVLVAELNQSDLFTKRARPTVVYFGLLLIAFNYCIVPLMTLFMPSTGLTALELPFEFWTAWGGIVATWSIGRSAEKIGVRNKVVKAVTGAKNPKKNDIDDWMNEES